MFTDPYLFPRSVDLLHCLDMEKLIGPIYPMSEAQRAFGDFQTAQYPKLLVKCAQ